MGNSLQDYRIRIGLFGGSSYSFKSKNVKLSAHRNKSDKSNINPRFCLLILLLSSVVYQAVAENSRNYKRSRCQEHSTNQEHSINQEHSTNQEYGSKYILRRSLPYQYLSNSAKVTDFNFLARYTNGNGRSRNGLKMAHINLGGGFLINRKNEIEHIIGDYKPHVLGISETRFEHNHSLEDVNIDNYDLYLCKTLQNPQLRTSRCAVYVHKDVVVKERLDLMNETFSSVWLELGLPKQKKILVANIYREWQYLHQGNDNSSLTIPAQLQRWNSFLDQWEMAIIEEKEVHCMGDTNIDYLKWKDTSQPGEEDKGRLRPLIIQLFDRIIPHGFVQLMTGSTRVQRGQAPSGLDHYYTNRPHKVNNIHAYYHGSSDHKLIFAVRHSKVKFSKPRIIMKRCYKNFDPALFLAEVRNISWWEVYSCENVESAAELFTNKLNNILNKMAPVKKFQVRSNYAPWMSDQTKEKIKTRDAAQQKASETGSDEDWREYKSIRNLVNSILRKEKETWQRAKLEEYSEDSGSTWKNVKNWLGWRTGGPPTKLIEDGEMHSKPAKLANIMNTFFVQKVRNLRSNLPDSPGDPLELTRSIMSGNSSSFSLRAVHPEEITKIINSLKSTKSCGNDNIDTYVIKLAKEELTPVITHLVNLSITNNVFPNLWKNAKVIPLHKKDEVIYPKNYRPVALLPIASKILERAVFLQLIAYLENNDLLHPSHHGFRSKHNTSTALLQMVDVWLEALEDDEVSAVVMLDMSAAFDVVDHRILLDKLEQFGLDAPSKLWFESYLTGRTQQVFIDGSYSESLELEAGVPQGSILGPLLYICFTNDLPEVVHGHLSANNTLYNTHCKACGGICCFADDSTYTKSDKDPEVVQNGITEKYNQISDYMAKNRLVLNSDKTHLMVMATPYQHRVYGDFGITLNTGTEEIEPVYCEKLLGGYISNNFKWNEHVRGNDGSIFKTLVSRINALRKISNFSNFKTRKMIADGVVISRLIYLIQLWGGCPDYLLDFLQTLQNRAARLVCGGGRFTPVKKLLDSCGWMSVRQLVSYHRVLLLFKIRTEGKPRYFKDKFTSNSNPNYNTRFVKDEGIKKERRLKKEDSMTSFVPSSIDIWNRLPVHLRQSKDARDFKTKLRPWIKEKIEI